MIAPVLARAGVPDASPDAARTAWESGRLLPYALELELGTDALDETWRGEIAAWESSWDGYVGGRRVLEKSEAREERVARLAGYCPAAATHPVCLALRSDLMTASDAELDALHGATVLADFLKSTGIVAREGVVLSEFFTRREYNCASSSLVALHLLQRAGVTAFDAFQMPDHVNLSLTLASGRQIFLNNAREFLPRSYFQNPPSSTAYVKLAGEKPGEPWTVAASVHINSGKRLYLNRDLKGALESWRRALALNPDNATIVNNLGAAYSVAREWELARKLYEQAIALNPNYARARDNLRVALAAMEE